MSLTHSTTARNASVNAVVALLSGANGPGRLQCLISVGGAAAATLPTQATFAAAASGGVAAVNNPTPDGSAAGNATPVSVASFQDQAHTEVFRGVITATGGGGDITLSSTTINTGDSVTITSITYTGMP